MIRTMISTLQRLACDARGGALIEFAILCPLLMVLTLGGLDFGRMFYVRQGLEYATESAARYYAVNPSAAQSTITSYLQGLMVGGLGNNVNVSYTSSGTCTTNTSVTCTTVTATYNFTFAVGYLGLPPIAMQTSSMAMLYANY
jgi:Flp pilus assembly protein TadG